MNSQEISISVEKTLDLIQNLIETKQGDPGRLRYIFESLQKGRPLFNSDRVYLERKIHAKTEILPPKPPSGRDELVKAIKKIIDWKVGDPGRLNYMLSAVKKGKELFQTDLNYLDKKLESLPKRRIKRIHPTMQKVPPIPEIEPEPKFEKSKTPESDITREFVIHLKADLKEAREIISNLKTELNSAHEIIRHLELKLIRQKQEMQNIKERKLAKKESIQDPAEFEDVQRSISDEEKAIHKQREISEDIKQQRVKLNQLVSYREEYEKRVRREQDMLNKQIKEENQRIVEKDKLVDELTRKQEEIKQSRAEREVILEQIKREQSKLEDELGRQRKELEKAKKEYDKLSKSSKNEDKSSDSKNKNNNSKKD